jgi:hypothetical protein
MMSDFPNGVTYYSQYHVDILQGFPEGRKACKYCRFCIKDRNSGMDSRFTCLLTWEYLYNLSHTGQNCPLIKIKEE